MRKIVIIILAMVVALAALPVTFACYNGGWGHWHHFWRPHRTVYCCTTDCSITFDYDSLSYYDNEETFTEPKEVAQTYAEITDCGKNLSVTVNNAYPGYAGTVDFCIRNDGFYPATVNGLEIVKDIPFYADLDFTGIVMGTVIPAGDMQCGQLVIHNVPQTEESQDKYFTFDITIDFSCFPTGCETAYAYHRCYAHCFLQYYQGVKFNNWGWTNGPLPPSCYSYYFDLYAGAGQCIRSNDKKVGWLKVNYNGSTAIVTYNMFYGHKMTKTDLYVGTEPWPRKNGNGDFTVAPGQYPYHDGDATLVTDTKVVYVIPVSGPIYIIAHADVCR
jgi:hypothetical protein